MTIWVSSCTCFTVQSSMECVEWVWAMMFHHRPCFLFCFFVFCFVFLPSFDCYVQDVVACSALQAYTKYDVHTAIESSNQYACLCTFLWSFVCCLGRPVIGSFAALIITTSCDECYVVAIIVVDNGSVSYIYKVFKA